MGSLIFSRRQTQALLDELRGVIPAKQLRRIAADLDTPGRKRVSSIWELVFLYGISMSGDLAHERELSSGTRPDFSVSLSDGVGSFELLGDITAVSDKGLDDRNPIDELAEQLVRVAKKYGVDPNTLRFDVQGKKSGTGRKVSMDLLLPPKGEIARLANTQIAVFLKRVSASPVEPANLHVKSEFIDVKIGYKPGQWGMGGGYASYQTPYSLVRNPIANALSEKASQLGAAPEGAVRLVILCDADCYAMRGGMLKGPGAFDAKDITREFLRKSDTLDLVLLVTVSSSVLGSISSKHLQLSCELVAAPVAARPSRLTESRIRSISDMLNVALKALPPPKTDPCNAVNRCEERGFGFALHGAYTIAGVKSVKISSRAVLELLAGKMTFERFEQLHRWHAHDGEPNRNPFAARLDEGRLIEHVEVTSGGNDDDDWVEFSFGARDPAVSRFIVSSEPGSSDATN